MAGSGKRKICSPPSNTPSILIKNRGYKIKFKSQTFLVNSRSHNRKLRNSKPDPIEWDEWGVIQPLLQW